MFVFLLYFNAEVVRHEPNISNLELIRHLFLKLVEHAWIATCKDQVIYIQAHNQNIAVLDFDVECVLIWTFDENSFLVVLVNSSISSS